MHGGRIFRDWDPDRTVKAELQPGEIVRWMGQPSFFPMLWSQIVPIVVGLSFLGFLAMMGIGPQAGVGSLLFMSVFVLIGLGAVGGGLLEAFGVWRTVYAVTNRRVLIIKCFMRHRVLAIAPGGMNAYEWHENADGSGSITVRREDSTGESTTKMGFVGTRDIRGAIREVEKLRADET